MEGWFFFASFSCLCVFVLLLVKVVLFSLNWNTSIVYNFYSYLSPRRCLLHTYFACVFPTCLLRTCSTYLLHVANLLPATYFCILHLCLPLPTYLLPPSPPTCFHTFIQVPNTYLPTFLFAYFELQACLPTWYFPFTYLHKRWCIEGMHINL